MIKIFACWMNYYASFGVYYITSHHITSHQSVYNLAAHACAFMCDTELPNIFHLCFSVVFCCCCEIRCQTNEIAKINEQFTNKTIRFNKKISLSTKLKHKTNFPYPFKVSSIVIFGVITMEKTTIESANISCWAQQST